MIMDTREIIKYILISFVVLITDKNIHKSIVFARNFNDIERISNILGEQPENSGPDFDFEWINTLKEDLIDKVRKNVFDANLLNNKVSGLNLTNLTSECERDFTRYQDELLKRLPEEWALRMADSDGKVGSGIIDGHTRYEGSYPECTIIKEPESRLVQEPIEAQYCFLYWWAVIPNLPDPFPVDPRVFLRGKGICIPDTCDEMDAEILLRNVYADVLLDANDIIDVHCVSDVPLNAEAIITIVILSMFGALVLIGTLYDWNYHRRYSHPTKEPAPKKTQQIESIVSPKSQAVSNDDDQVNTVHVNKDGAIVSNGNGIKISSVEMETLEDGNKVKFRSQSFVENTSTTDSSAPKKGLFGKLLTAFSLMTTIPVLVSAKAPKGSYKYLNGIRGLATMFIVFGHTWGLGPLGPNVVENMYPYVKSLYTDWTMWKMITFDIMVDTFLVLSALLATISFLKKLKKTNGKLTFSGMALHYFMRYWRLTPTYMIILMIYTNLWHYFGKGPFMWDNKEDADSCSDVWWRNMLYINNFWDLFETVPGCMGWSWYLAVDFQMFVIAPLFIYVFYRNKIAGAIFTMAGFAGGIIANVVLHHKLYFPEEGENISEFRDIYVTTWTRCTTYFMGILLGYLFYHTGAKVRMHKALVCFGWVFALSMYTLVTYLPYLKYCTGSDACGQWSEEGLIAWGTLKRPMWALWVCWLIWACQTGYGGFVNTFLSWNFFIPLAKLSYGVYLIHPILCYLYFDRSPTGIFATNYIAVYIFFGHLLAAHLLSFVVTAVISNPLMDIAIILLPKRTYI